MKKVVIYTDGACSGNPGPGGWAAILRFGDKEKAIKGGERLTTNNRMELMAAIKGLEALKEKCMVDIYTDSSYVKDGITKWISDWKKKNWRNGSKNPVKNVDLWQQLELISEKHEVKWHWVRGHNGDTYNDKVDKLAVEARKEVVR